MRPSKTLVAALVAGALPLFAGAAAAGPISHSMALKNADVSAVEQIQFRRRGWRSGRWIGPAAGFAAGVAIGSALAPRAYDDGYYAYGAAPGDGYYAYGAAPGYVEPGYGYGYRTERGYDRDAPAPGSSGRCQGDAETNSAFPSWMCR